MIMPNIGMPGFPPPPVAKRAATLPEITIGLCLNRARLAQATASAADRNHRLALDAALSHEWRALFKAAA
jgi:hypothetical protein